MSLVGLDDMFMWVQVVRIPILVDARPRSQFLAALHPRSGGLETFHPQREGCGCREGLLQTAAWTRGVSGSLENIT